MYSLKVIGPDVRIVTPDGGEYRFNGYGDYGMRFTQDDMAAVVNTMRDGCIVAVHITLTDAIKAVRSRMLTGDSDAHP